MNRCALVIALVLAPLGCLSTVDPNSGYVFACDANGACPSGQACVAMICVAGASPDGGPDAGADGGPDAGTDGGPDAGTDGGTDAGLDGGPDGGLSAGCIAQFLPSLQVQAGEGCSGIAAADFNHDGWIDLLAVDSANGGLNILFNHGAGQLAAEISDTSASLSPPSCEGPVYPVGVAAGDLNGDGWSDLVLSTPDVNSVGSLLNNHDGGFTPGMVASVTPNTPLCPGSFPPPYSPVALGLFDGGWGFGALDIDDGFTATIAVRDAGTVLGTPQFVETFSDSPTGLTVADINHDGLLDMAAIVTPASSQSRIDVFLGNADAGLTLVAGEITAGNGTADVRFADINGDGLMDVVFVDTNDNDVGVSFGRTSGIYSSAVKFTTRFGDGGASPMSLVVADLDGDGQPDVATVNDHSITILQGYSDGGLAAVQSLPTTASGAFFIVAADFGTDGGGAPPWLAVSYNRSASQNQVDIFQNVCP